VTDEPRRSKEHEPTIIDVDLSDDAAPPQAATPIDVEVDVAGEETPARSVPDSVLGARTFQGAPGDYDRHEGRTSRRLAQLFQRGIGVYPGQTGLDVGCGTGGLTYEMAALLGPDKVRAIDPSAPYVEACREKVWGVEVTEGRAEELPYADGQFDIVLAQLVLSYLEDPLAGVTEMRRVLHPGGTVAACVWDVAGEMHLLRSFWEAASAVDPEGAEPYDERNHPLRAQHELGQLWKSCGFGAVSLGQLEVTGFYRDFDDLWAPFPTGVGISGAYTASLDEEHQQELRGELFKRLGSPEGFFELTALALYVAGS
jgi:SAM-dependent methyltransferase